MRAVGGKRSKFDHLFRKESQVIFIYTGLPCSHATPPKKAKYLTCVPSACKRINIWSSSSSHCNHGQAFLGLSAGVCAGVGISSRHHEIDARPYTASAAANDWAGRLFEPYRGIWVLTKLGVVLTALSECPRVSLFLQDSHEAVFKPLKRAFEDSLDETRAGAAAEPRPQYQTPSDRH